MKPRPFPSTIAALALMIALPAGAQDSGTPTPEALAQVYTGKAYSPYAGRAFQVTVSVPYSGDSSLWKLRPSSWGAAFPRAKVCRPGRNGLGHL